MSAASKGDGRAGVLPGGVFDRHQQSFADLTESARSGDRDLVASVLLDAVEQSFRPHERKARQWLAGVYAHALFVLIDISPTAAMEHLEKKWRRIDAGALTPPPGYVHH